LAQPALVVALASLLVPGGLLAIPAFYLAGKAEPGPKAKAARIISAAAIAMWIVIGGIVAVVVL